MAHRLAGSAFNLGARALGEVAREVEQHAMVESLEAVAPRCPGCRELAADLTRSAPTSASTSPWAPVRAWVASPPAVLVEQPLTTGQLATSPRILARCCRSPC